MDRCNNTRSSPVPTKLSQEHQRHRDGNRFSSHTATVADKVTDRQPSKERKREQSARKKESLNAHHGHAKSEHIQPVQRTSDYTNGTDTTSLVENSDAASIASGEQIGLSDTHLSILEQSYMRLEEGRSPGSRSSPANATPTPPEGSGTPNGQTMDSSHFNSLGTGINNVHPQFLSQAWPPHLQINSAYHLQHLMLFHQQYMQQMQHMQHKEQLQQNTSEQSEQSNGVALADEDHSPKRSKATFSGFNNSGTESPRPHLFNQSTSPTGSHLINNGQRVGFVSDNSHGEQTFPRISQPSPRPTNPCGSDVWSNGGAQQENRHRPQGFSPFFGGPLPIYQQQHFNVQQQYSETGARKSSFEASFPVNNGQMIMYN